MRYITLALGVIIFCLATGCRREGLIIDEIDREAVAGCYENASLPPIFISENEIYFDGEMISDNYRYDFDGRTTDKIIHIKPRVYFQYSDSRYHFSEVSALPDEYSAIFGFVEDGEQGRRIHLNSLAGKNPAYTKTTDESCRLAGKEPG